MAIKVLLVEDSPIALAILKKILQLSPEIDLVGTASNGVQALDLIPKTEPDVICTDLQMPQMDGIELTSKVMNLYPRPILVISASLESGSNNHRVFQVLEAGAVDIFPKPVAGKSTDYDQLREKLTRKIKVLAGVKVFKRERQSTSTRNLSAKTNISLETTSSHYSSIPKIVVVGSSTGGPQALQILLGKLPANFAVPVICVQHISEGFLEGLIDWLALSCTLPIKIAKTGDTPQPGVIYFPPEKLHLELNSFGRFLCSDDEPVERHRPSVTVTFRSVAKFYGNKTVGILLSGMGRDGAEGMQDILQAGGFTIAQDESTSVVFGMPKEAIALGAASQVLPIEAIAPALLQRFLS